MKQMVERLDDLEETVKFMELTRDWYQLECDERSHEVS